LYVEQIIDLIASWS